MNLYRLRVVPERDNLTMAEGFKIHINYDEGIEALQQLMTKSCIPVIETLNTRSRLEQ